MALDQDLLVEDSASRALLERDLEQSAGNDGTYVERREPRSETNWIATIRLLDGTEIPCNVKDISKSGARLGVPKSYALPDTFMLKVVGRNFVCLMKVAWRRGNYAGVRIERVGKLPGPPAVAAEPLPAKPTVSTYQAIGSRRSRVSSF